MSCFHFVTNTIKLWGDILVSVLTYLLRFHTRPCCMCILNELLLNLFNEQLSYNYFTAWYLSFLLTLMPISRLNNLKFINAVSALESAHAVFIRVSVKGTFPYMMKLREHDENLWCHIVIPFCSTNKHIRSIQLVKNTI